MNGGGVHNKIYIFCNIFSSLSIYYMYAKLFQMFGNAAFVSVGTGYGKSKRVQ